ncbi:hypothetical protein SH668x_002990 [Planctomicrobium sp. SH668]|uniref:hypothetical protein n=1 Tax=Planctomicrobium sp. SH668 TaxID=3448126 RepID=UPI003F5B6A3D
MQLFRLHLAVVFGALLLLRSAVIADEIQEATLPPKPVQKSVLSMVEFQKDSDQAETLEATDGQLISIKSKTGIGRGVIHRPEEGRPRTTLRLHLNGMESLQLSTEKISLLWSWHGLAGEGTGEFSARKRLLPSQDESEVAAADPLFAEVRLNQSCCPEAERMSKCFEVTIPSAFLKSNPATIEIQFIDFYR